MLEKVGIKMHRVALGKNDLATIDRGIATLKGLITKRTISKEGGNWVEELQPATRSYNHNAHSHLGGEPPEDVENNDSLQFQLQAQAARDSDKQTTTTQNTTMKLLDAGNYRVEVKSKLKGFAKERSFKPKYEEQVRQFASFNGRNRVDTQGRESIASRAKPVPYDSNIISYKENATSGDSRLEGRKREATIQVATDISTRVLTRATNIGTITKGLTDEQKEILKTNKLTTKKFIQLHADMFTLENNTVTRKEIRKKLGAIPFSTVAKRLKRLRERGGT